MALFFTWLTAIFQAPQHVILLLFVSHCLICLNVRMSHCLNSAPHTVIRAAIKH